MNIEEKYTDKDIEELGKIFFELGNMHLVPELKKQYEIALDQFKELQKKNIDLNEIIVVADIKEKIFVFALGDGSDLENKESDCVFHIARSNEFIETMAMLDYICFENHDEGYLSTNQEVCHWISDALPKINNLSINIYYQNEYAETEDDPVFQGLVIQ